MGIETIGGDSFVTTSVDAVVNWGRRNSLWPLPFGTACCGIEMMSGLASRFDLSRFGAEVVRFSPRQADLLIVAGTICIKMAPVIRTVYDQMMEPKWVIAMGACASSGGIYKTYSTVQGVDRVLPVDMYIPGCAPRPDAFLDALLKLQARIQGETGADRHSLPAAARTRSPHAGRGAQPGIYMSTGSTRSTPCTVL